VTHPLWTYLILCAEFVFMHHCTLNKCSILLVEYFWTQKLVSKSFILFFFSKKYTFTLQRFHGNSVLVIWVPQILIIWRPLFYMNLLPAIFRAHGTSQKTNILILTALWTSNLTHVIKKFKVKWEIAFFTWFGNWSIYNVYLLLLLQGPCDVKSVWKFISENRPFHLLLGFTASF
jgi:hypothetical protein